MAQTADGSGVRSRVSERLTFAINFLRHPHMLGSIIPSSRYLVNAVLEGIDWARSRVFVEYGPGVGTFTGAILRRMRSDARLVVIETNHDFVRFIGEAWPDARLHVEHDSAENVRLILDRLNLARADYILSGIPLGSMRRPLQEKISIASRDALDDEGQFLVYQFTSRVLPALRSTFQQVRRGFELRNFPPAQWFVCSGAPVKPAPGGIAARLE